jgi:hypothetical protein
MTAGRFDRFDFAVVNPLLDGRITDANQLRRILRFQTILTRFYTTWFIKVK